jgi:protein required for attachment to host cells
MLHDRSEDIMQRTCIAVVDAARARLIILTRTNLADGGPGEELTETADLANPGRRLVQSQLFSDSRPGSSRVAGRGFAFDDHRDAHVDHLDTEFARAVIDEIERTLADSGATRLVLCASPRMLGALRGAGLRAGGASVEEIARDFSNLSTHQIQARLVRLGLLPASPPRAALAVHA